MDMHVNCKHNHLVALGILLSSPQFGGKTSNKKLHIKMKSKREENKEDHNQRIRKILWTIEEL